MYGVIRELGLDRGKGKELLNRMPKDAVNASYYYIWIKRASEWPATEGNVVKA